MSRTSFSVGTERHINAVRRDMDTMEELINAISLEAEPGSDDALDAGYDPSIPDEINAMAMECQSMAARVENYDKQVDAKLQALKDYEDTVPATQPSGNRENRSLHKAAVQVLTFLVNSPTNFQTFFQGLGIPLTDELKEALQRAATSVTDSQANRWLQGGNFSVEVLNLEIQLNGKELSLKKALGDIEIQKELVRQMREKRDNLQSQLDGKTKALEKMKESESTARAQTRKFSSKVLELQKDLDVANEENTLLKDEMQEQRQRDAEEHSRKVDDLQAQLVELSQEKASLGLEKDELAAKVTAVKREAKARINQLKSAVSSAETASREVEGQLQEAHGSIYMCRRELGEAQEENRSLKEKVAKLEDLDAQAKGLMSDKDGQIEAQGLAIAARDTTIENQVQNVALVLRNVSVSLDTDSQIWRTAAETTLRGSASECVSQWQPWKISSSWSPDKSLAIYDHERSLEATALDALAILGTNCDVTQLLTTLEAFQRGIIRSSTLSPIAQLLLSSFKDAAGDARLHLMHRISMYQVATLLVSSAETLLPLSHAMDAVDPRVSRLVKSLKARDMDVQIPLADSIDYGNMSLVGFGCDPAGVLLLRDREIRWIDLSRIREDAREIAISTGNDNLRLPKDSAERVLWSLAHL
ncbi:hypothetical protein IL306_011537 [Fusarium sp. DS 682]|nr:hypothetical protein IL306_011537 [Fusarium sp. DS 682]